MILDIRFVALVGIVFVAYAVQTAAGFGSMILCVTLGAQLYEIPELLTVLVPLSLVQSGYIVVRHRRGIDKRLLFLLILPLMGVGMIVGYRFFAAAQGPALRMGFAVLVLLLALRELWQLRASALSKPRPPISPAATWVALLSAGVVHGVYATGGPLLVYAIGRRDLSKYAFRSTVTCVWLALNSALTVQYAAAGRFTAQTGIAVGCLALAIPLGIFVGERLHDRVDERRFKQMVFGMLVAAAVVLLAR